MPIHNYMRALVMYTSERATQLVQFTIRAILNGTNLSLIN